MAFTVPANVILPWPTTAASIPAGWSRETSLDGRYVKAIATAATDPGGTGGSNTHDHALPVHSHTGGSHSHTASSPSGGPSTSNSNGGAPNSSTPTTSHTHTPTYNSAANPTSANSSAAQVDTANNDAPWLEVIFIKSDGTPNGFPYLAMAWYDAAAPANWSAYANATNRLMKGAAAAGNGGGTGGAGDAHQHTKAHTHTSGGTHVHTMSSGGPSALATQRSPPAGGAVSTPTHTHTMANSGAADGGALTSHDIVISNGDVTPPWKKLLAIQNTSGVSVTTKGVYAIWLGTLATIPAGWVLADGNNGTQSMVDVYSRGANGSGEIGNTGGATTHAHADAVGHFHVDTVHNGHTSSSLQSGVATETIEQPFTAVWVPDHTHTAAGNSNNNTAANSGTTTTALAANTSNDPLFTRVAWIKFINSPPDVPVIVSPLASSTYSGSIGLSATVNDNDGDNVYAEFQYDRNDNNWTTIGNGSTVVGSGTSTRQWDISAIQPGFSYRVRARANDGTTVSAYATTGTFIIGPGFAALFASKNTTNYSAQDNTSKYYAASNTTSYRAEKN